MSENHFTLTKEYLHEIFDYRDGNLYWKIKKAYKIKIGQKAGSLQSDKQYFQVSINKKWYALHRIIFMMHNGYFPKEIDHIDRNPSNNRIENLREASASQNAANRNIRKTNKFGVKNVSFVASKGKYRVQIRLNNKNIHIGYFKDLESAKTSALQSRVKYFGEFA